MLRKVFEGCLWLDHWLHTRLGRPYGMLLTVGLMVEILRKFEEAPARFASPHGWLATVFALLLNLALLIHQLGEMAERVKTRHGTVVAGEGAGEELHR